MARRYLRKNRETTDVQREGFAKAVKMGVKLAYGTDSGVYPHGRNANQSSTGFVSYKFVSGSCSS